MTMYPAAESIGQQVNDAIQKNPRIILYALDSKDLVQLICDTITAGEFDSYLKELGRTVFDRRDVKLGKEQRPIVPPSTVTSDTAVTTTITPVPSNHQFSNNSGLTIPAMNRGGALPASSPLAQAITQQAAQNQIPKLDKNNLGRTPYFIYRGNYYAKSEIRGKELMMPNTVQPQYMAGVMYQVTGVGNKRLKVILTSEPKVGTKFHECWLRKTELFLPLDYIAHLLEN